MFFAGVLLFETAKLGVVTINHAVAIGTEANSSADDNFVY